MIARSDATAASQSETLISPQRKSLLRHIREFMAFRELLYFFVWKNLKVRYAQAVLGVAWTILQPLLTALIMAVVLGRVARVPTDGIPPFLFYFCGLVSWTYFSNAVTTSATSLVTNQSLIQKIYFPRLCLPISGVLSALVDLAVPLILLLIVMLAHGHFHVEPMMLIVLPLLLLTTTMAAVGLGTGLAALNLEYRDVGHALPFFIQMLFFASPILYPPHLPEPLRTIYFLNPMASVIDGFRAMLLQTHPVWWGDILTGLAVAFVMLVAGIMYFERVESRFADIA